jgi:hypothetical protein
MKTRLYFAFAALILILAGCLSEKNNWDWSSGKNLTKCISKKGAFELSGLHWNTKFSRLYIVQDNGNLRVLQLDTTTDKFSSLAHVKLTGGPEGVTQVDNDSNEFYVINEKSCEIRRYIHNNDFTSVTLANHWDLKAAPSNMTAAENEGPEGIEFVPDSYLKAVGFVSSETNQKYLSAKGMHGLMFIAHQKKGLLWVYDVNPSKNDDYTFVGTYKTDQKESCDLAFDRSTGLLYILHNIGENSVEATDLSTESVLGSYQFVEKKSWLIPVPSGSQNIEGFAISPKFGKNPRSNVWLCRDIATDEEGRDRKDCLRWYKDFDAAGK